VELGEVPVDEVVKVNRVLLIETVPESVTELDDLSQLAAFADAVYADHWIGCTITPSA